VDSSDNIPEDCFCLEVLYQSLQLGGKQWHDSFRPIACGLSWLEMLRDFTPFGTPRHRDKVAGIT
jgi:hypothetical protein